MLAAERLFGRHGIEAVSLREIAAAAGQANNSAVQYYFGTKEGLVQAVFEMRMPQLDSARARWFEARNLAVETATLEELMGALLMPVLTEFRRQDLQNFIHFMTRLAHRDTVMHPFFHAQDITPVSMEVFRAIKALFADMPEEAFSVRLRLAVDLFLDGYEERLRLDRSTDDPYPQAGDFWRDMLDMAIAVMETPFRPGR